MTREQWMTQKVNPTKSIKGGLIFGTSIQSYLTLTTNTLCWNSCGKNVILIFNLVI